MDAGLTDPVWSVEELVSLMLESQAKKRGPYNSARSDEVIWLAWNHLGHGSKKH